MKKTILICDDEEGIRESLRLILEQGYDLLFAESGADAANKLAKNNIDIVILDIKMPKKDGFETLKELTKIKPGIKVIIATGYKSVETVQEASRLGAVDYIVKPFKTSDILQAVEQAL